MPRAVNGRKVCSRCGVEKLVAEFTIQVCRADGLRYNCKQCDKVYRQTDPDKKKASDARYREKNHDKILAQMSKYNTEHRDAISVQKAKNRAANRERIAVRDSAYYRVHRDELLAKSKAYGKKNRNEITAHQRERRKKDSVLRFNHGIRSLIAQSFKRRGFRKNSKTAQILGCSIEDARIRIGWFPGCRIHHIVPMETARTMEDVIRLNHHTNLVALTVEAHNEIHRKMREGA